MRDFIATLLLYQASVFVLFFKVVIFMWVISLDYWGSLVNWGLLKYQKKRRANTRHERHDHPHAMMLLLLENCVVFKNFACFLRKEGFLSCTNTWTFVRVIENIVTMTKMQIGKTHVTGSLLFLTTRQFGKQQVLEETRQESISKGHLWLLHHSVFFQKSNHSSALLEDHCDSLDDLHK